MTKTELARRDSAIKKINERYIQICREFGANSGIATDYKNAMELVAGSENLMIISSTTSKKAPKNNPDYETGEIKVAQIKRNKKTLEALKQDELDALLNKHTAGQIKKAAQEEAKTQSDESGDRITMSEVIDAMDAVYDYLDENGYDSKDNEATHALFDFYWTAVGPGAPKPSYTDLHRIINVLNKGEKAKASVSNYLTNKYGKRDVGEYIFGGI